MDKSSPAHAWMSAPPPLLSLWSAKPCSLPRGVALHQESPKRQRQPLAHSPANEAPLPPPLSPSRRVGSRSAGFSCGLLPSQKGRSGPGCRGSRRGQLLILKEESGAAASSLRLGWEREVAERCPARPEGWRGFGGMAGGRRGSAVPNRLPVVRSGQESKDTAGAGKVNPGWLTGSRKGGQEGCARMCARPGSAMVLHTSS